MVIEEMRIIDAQHELLGGGPLDHRTRHESKHVIPIGGRRDLLRKKVRQRSERDAGRGVGANSEGRREALGLCQFEALGSQARLPHARSSREYDAASVSTGQEALDEVEFLSATDEWPGRWHSRGNGMPGSVSGR
jgi:hypothetical protein